MQEQYFKNYKHIGKWQITQIYFSNIPINIEYYWYRFSKSIFRKEEEHGKKTRVGASVNLHNDFLS
jgi:hypothetical protein